MSSSEVDAVKLREELESGQDVESVLLRIKGSLSWTPTLAQSSAGKALLAAINSAPLSTARQEVKDAYHTQLREAEVVETEKRWWSYPPVVAGDSDIYELSFVDATAGDERWETERVPCSAGESFAHPAQRFRVAANKKHRHPFLPSVHFDILLGDDNDGRATFGSLDSRTVADVLGEKTNEVRYVRDDDGRAQREEQRRSPARLFAPWDRARIFPSWCATPDSWLECAPPPGFNVARKVPGEQFYAKVPTLHVPGAGILPAARTPQLIARALYLPVRELVPSGQIIAYPLDQEHDYVPTSHRLVPSALTTDAARALLGRVIQSSTEPSRDDAPPSNKKRKKSASNKFASQTVAIAWGLTLDDEGNPDWLHCVQPALNWQNDLVLDMKGLGRSFGRAGVVHKNCAWVGAAVLDADVRALENAVMEPQGQVHEPFDKWADKTQRWIRNLNADGVDKLVEVGPDGTFVAGDVEMSKGDADEWESSISGAKPGVWRMSVSASSVVQFIWAREGTVDYDALPPLEGDVLQHASNNDTAEWEELGTFSVDSGNVGLFSESVLDSLTGEGDRQAKIETLIDARLDGFGPFMPGGVVVSQDDGGYVVEGKRDEDGKVVKLRVRQA